jgi:hypothetical protein
MKGIKRLGLGVAVLGALLALAGFVAGSVFAISGSISISDGSAEPGGSGTVELRSDVGDDPFLGAWTIDISYDPAVVTPTDCDAEEGGVCNPAFTEDSIRVTGASANGVEGDTLLATIELECADDEATTDLTLAVDVFADATIGDPQDIEPTTVVDGSFACEVAPTAGPTTVPATATVAGGAGGIGSVGTGTGSDSTGMSWVIVALAGAGLFALTSVTALRMSARRS